MITNYLNPVIFNTVLFFGIGLVVLRLLFIGGAILECFDNKKSKKL